MLRPILFVFLLTFNFSSSGDVLMLVPFGSMSHKIIFDPIARELGAHGHNVTLVSAFKPSGAHPNVTEILVPGIESLLKNLMEGFLEIGEGLTYSLMSMFGDTCGQLCDNFFQTKLLQNWMESGREFDAVMVDGVMAECLVSVGHLMSPAVILINTAFLFSWVATTTNVPTPYAVIPNIFEGTIPPMDFWQRVRNAYVQEKSRLLFKHVLYPPMDKAVQRHFPNAKSVIEAMADLNLVLANGDSVLSLPQVQMPHVVNVGGLHLVPSKPLPKSLEELVESSSGVVLFSLGSIFDGLLTNNEVNNFLQAFSKLKYQIIWKYKKELENLPRNVKILKWIPQADLLAHKKVRVFITHAGLLSLQESFNHQVPTVTLPLFADQPQNANFLASINCSVPLTWNNLTVENIFNAVTRAAEDKTLRKNVERLSKIFKDVPQPPLKKAVYWIEHVMRHKGAHHLQTTAKELNFFQYFLIDIFLFLLSLSVLAFLSFRFAIRQLR